MEKIMASLLARLRQVFRSQRRHARVAQQTAAQSETYKQIDFQSLTENSADVILRVGPDMRASYVSPSSRQVLGWAPDELVGKHPIEIFLAEDFPAIEAAASQIYTQGASTVAPVARVRCKDGSVKWCESRAQLLKGTTDALGDVVVILRDVTERKELEIKLAAMAMTDGLTELANRRAFDEALTREWKATFRTGSPTSLLLLDLDHFKAFNDQYGHQVGDDCLRSVAAAVGSTVRRPRDFVARYGGEELAVILPETDSAGAIYIAEQVRQAVERLMVPHSGNREGNSYVTVSIGVTTAVPSVGGTVKMPEGLLLTADSALYKAKHHGRNRVEVSILLTPVNSELGGVPRVS
jgi:diguanylate cyclase (GGDEF)-like protein/PAS domain S-box-containing protein